MFCFEKKTKDKKGIFSVPWRGFLGKSVYLRGNARMSLYGLHFLFSAYYDVLTSFKPLHGGMIDMEKAVYIKYTQPNALEDIYTPMRPPSPSKP